MALSPEDLPHDPDRLVAMVLAQAIEIDKLQAALKALKALIFGPRSERQDTIFDQMSLDLDDLAANPAPPAANDDERPASSGRSARTSARCPGICRVSIR